MREIFPPRQELESIPRGIDPVAISSQEGWRPRFIHREVPFVLPRKKRMPAYLKSKRVFVREPAEPAARMVPQGAEQWSVALQKLLVAPIDILLRILMHMHSSQLVGCTIKYCNIISSLLFETENWDVECEDVMML